MFSVDSTRLGNVSSVFSPPHFLRKSEGYELSGKTAYPSKAWQIKVGHIQQIAADSFREMCTAFAAFSSIKGKVTYVSTPVTSGTRLYDFMDKYSFITLKAAKDHPQYLREVVIANIRDAQAFTEALSAKGETVIDPTLFEERFREAGPKESLNWGQAEFMGMWVPVIEKTATKLMLRNGWQQSNGSSEEYLTAVMMQMGFTDRHDIAIVDQENNPLSLDKGLGLLVDAYADLKKRQLSSESLEKVIDALLEAEEQHNKSPHPDAQLPLYDREAFVRSTQEFAKHLCTRQNML